MKDFVDESQVMYWLGPVAWGDCGCGEEHCSACYAHPDRVAEAELEAERRSAPVAPGAGEEGEK